MSDFPQLFSDCNKTAVEFLLTDLDVAMTFMDVAATSDVQGTIDRNHQKARYAYDTVLRLLKNVLPDEQQFGAMNEKMALLRKRLQAVGDQF